MTPFGDLIADPARGLWMGNRGCLHNDRQQIVRHHVSARWIICQLQFKDRYRPVMTPGQYTELFFLDEATALAAGHRPCAECSRPRFVEFRERWAAANPQLAGGPKPTVSVIDAALQVERVGPQNEKITYREMLCNLPAGVIVSGESMGQAFLVREGRLWRWTPAGYTNPTTSDAHWGVRVLTPRSVVAAIRAGFQPQIHPSVEG